MLLVALICAAGFGTFRAFTDGRFRGLHRVRHVGPGHPVEAVETAWSHVRVAVPSAAAGERATLVQFSSAFCAPCRATRRILSDVAQVMPGAVHVEIDAEHHLELVRRLGVLRTPTTLVLDAAGAEVSRATGAPRKEQVLDALARLT